MVYVARRMQQRPNRVQTAVELAFTLMRDNITRGNMDSRMAAKWFPFIATLFLFIWFSNMIGYIPLPTNTEHKIDVFGVRSRPSRSTRPPRTCRSRWCSPLVVWISYNVEGIRAKGLVGYLKSLVPEGRDGPDGGFIFVLEFFSNVMRLMSLSVRLFANILAGHLIILFMAGGLAVLLGIAALGVITLPGGRRPLPLRGRPGRDAAGLHLRHAHRDLPRRRRRRGALTTKETLRGPRSHHHPGAGRLAGATPRTPARPSPSASAAASARRAPASASATSSAR